MGRIEKTVFISYRRTNEAWALYVYQYLTNHGFDVFIDFQNINSGNFESIILDNIRARAHFLIVLTPSALERCDNPNDWLRREIETALDEKRNIIPLMLEGFDFDSPLVKKALTGKLAALKELNALLIPKGYAPDAMERLRTRYLNVALSDVSLVELKAEEQQVTHEQKAAINEAEPVTEEQLTAQEWFERAYVFQEEKNLEEAERCYIKSIELNPNVAEPYYNLGILLDDLGRPEEAEGAYRQAIAEDPDFANAYYNLGNLLKDNNRYEEAEAAYRQAIIKDPNNWMAYSNLGNLLSLLGRNEEAEAALRMSIEKNFNYAIASNNLGSLLFKLKRYVEAEEAYRQAIVKDPNYGNAYFNLGALFASLERNEEAEVAFRQAIAINPNNASIYYNLACIKSIAGDTGLAFEYLQKAINLGLPDFSLAWQDPDLESLRKDPRFEQIVGPKPTE